MTIFKIRMHNKIKKLDMVILKIVNVILKPLWIDHGQNMRGYENDQTCQFHICSYFLHFSHKRTNEIPFGLFIVPSTSVKTTDSPNTQHLSHNPITISEGTSKSITFAKLQWLKLSYDVLSCLNYVRLVLSL